MIFTLNNGFWWNIILEFIQRWIFMKRQINDNTDKDELKKQIDELRDVLNEICATAQDSEGLEKRLLVSQHLDQIIVQYMNRDINCSSNN